MLVRGCPLSERLTFLKQMFWFHNNFSPVSEQPLQSARVQFMCLSVSGSSETCGLYEMLAGCSLLGDSMTFIPHLGLACLMSY